MSGAHCSGRVAAGADLRGSGGRPFQHVRTRAARHSVDALSLMCRSLPATAAATHAAQRLIELCATHRLIRRNYHHVDGIIFTGSIFDC